MAFSVEIIFYYSLVLSIFFFFLSAKTNCMRFLPVLLAVILLTGCSANKFYARMMKPGAIPSDLGKRGSTLLIMKYSAEEVEKTKLYGHNNEQLEKLAAAFPFPTVLVTKAELQSPKYADVNKYRYFLQPSEATMTEKETTKFENHSPTTRTYYYSEQFFTDRKEEKNLPLTNFKVRVFYQGVKIILSQLQNPA